MNTAETIVALIAQLANVYQQYRAAEAAGDQATLDAVSRQIEATSDAMAPAGGDPAVIIER